MITDPFSVLYIDNDMGDYLAVESYLSSKMPVEVEGILGAEPAAERIVFLSRCEFRINVRCFILEAVLIDGSTPDLIRLIRGASKFDAIPVVIYTGTDDYHAKAHCLATGAMQIIEKGPGTQGVEALAAYVAGLAQK